MGLFTVRCSDSDCGQRIGKGAGFCPRCGRPAPSARAWCGGCEAEVRADAAYCWQCGAELAKSRRAFIFEGRWARRPEDVAARLEDQDVAGRFSKPLLIEPGTRALLFQQGRCKGELGPGRHELRGIRSMLPLLDLTGRTTVVLVDAGDVVADLENDGLWTADALEVGTRLRVVMRITGIEALYTGLFKGRSKVTVDCIERELAADVHSAIQAEIGQLALDELLRGEEAPRRIEAAVKSALEPTLSRLGLELVQLRYRGLAGPAWERLQSQRRDLAAEAAEADLTEQRSRLQQRLRQTLTQEKLDAFQGEHELEAFIRQAEHELGLKGIVRDDEMKRLTERFRIERQRQALLDRLEIEGIEHAERREQAWKELMAREQRRDEQHQRELARRQAEAQQDEAEAQAGIERLRQVKQIEREEDEARIEQEARLLDIRSRATAEALLSILDGPPAQRIAELEKLRIQQNFTAEQMFALAAQASPDTARALADTYDAAGKLTPEQRRRLETGLPASPTAFTDPEKQRLHRVMQMARKQMTGGGSGNGKDQMNTGGAAS